MWCWGLEGCLCRAGSKERVIWVGLKLRIELLMWSLGGMEFLMEMLNEG